MAADKLDEPKCVVVAGSTSLSLGDPMWELVRWWFIFDRYHFLGNHFCQFLANSSTFAFVIGISSPFTKLEGGFLFSTTLL
jgi:hypothetical protein